FKANQSKYRIDTANIVTGGESAGAVTAMTAAYVDKISELKNYKKASPQTLEGDSGNPGYGTRPKAVMCLCGVGDTTAMERPSDPPMLWIHGSKDPLLPIQWGQQVVTRAKNIGLLHKAIVFKGATHCPWYYGLPNWRNYMDSTVTYISKFLYHTGLGLDDDEAFKKVKPIPEKYQALPFGAVKPKGWLKQQVQANLNGFTGHLDSLVPDLILKDDIYAKDRLTRKIKSKDVGAQGGGGAADGEDTSWQVQFLWWNSETQSNWRDGYIRSAILAGDKKHLARIATYIKNILATQDADGYLGIYDKELRYKFNQENGELWAKATLLRGLLAWYDYTKDKAVLTAVTRAVDNVMINWPINNSHPFLAMKPDVSGLSHGLMFTDVLESLYQLTGNQKYMDYSLFMYKDFSAQVINEDAQYRKLLDTTMLLRGHGVHTYEHLRTVAAAYYASGNPQLKLALSNFLNKITLATTASGGPVGDEWVLGKKADATKRGYEYCSLQELLHSYASIYAKTGNKDYGGKIEKLFFNAAQGARHPSQSGIAYLKSDNSYAMEGWLNLDSADKHQVRYKYSPVHQDAAVCCVPNAGRIAPYYIQNMWMKSANSIIAALLGPSVVNTTINGKQVTVNEVTAYPNNNVIKFEVTANTKFALKIRKPDWAEEYKINTKYTEEDGFIVIDKAWNGKQIVEITFVPKLKVNRDINNEVYFSYGANVLAMPINATESKGKSYPVPGFFDYHYSPKSLSVLQYAGYPAISLPNAQGRFVVKLFNPATNAILSVKLIPMSETILRQVTFKHK
ncbi:MAG: hypothetical protein EOP46_15395, partial [Sphingobacteriaceae bacterium]